MSVTATTIDASVSRWIEEAKNLPAREAYRCLTRKARFVDREFRRCAGDAWALAIGRDRLLTAATSYRT
ncbi:hypothetical protein JIX59_03675 [Brevundimonas diminuta]|uniref:hypothetical protein n=1 Tax=Brevundimonas diminuta TaxID=293 RepID=UPI0019074A83|nr:hypothetical protein [Brevundimonas diminuta]MBK1968432.1 hypothetical protein [Brevundimonas diminuta]